MASSLLLLLDDIATILDDVAMMSKMATKKTAGVLGDDLAYLFRHFKAPAWFYISALYE